MNKEIKKIYKQIKKKIGQTIPEIGIILGSGLGALANIIENPTKIPYNEIKGFPQSTVVGHAGNLIIGELQGKKVLCMQGRIHLYEGHSPAKIALIIRVFKSLGISKMIITNASGSLREDYAPGDLVLIKDHINFSFKNPLVGENDDNIGPRFLDMTETYSEALRNKMEKAAKKEKIALKEGVYMMVTGPCFETPAEVRAYATLGADIVGMSTVPEVISAVHAGMEVVAISTVTNFAAGLHPTKLSHSETVEQANLAGTKLQKLILAFIKEI